MMKKIFEPFLLAFIFCFFNINFEVYSCSNEEPVDKFEKARNILFSSFENYDPEKIYTSEGIGNSDNPYSNFLEYHHNFLIDDSLNNKEHFYNSQEPSSDYSKNVYEKVLEITGIINYRRYPTVIWAKNFANLFQSKSSLNYERLISIQLHHLAGDMIHIAKVVKNDKYVEQINSVRRRNYIIGVVDSYAYRNNELYIFSTQKLLQLKISSEDLKAQETSKKQMFLRFIELLEVFEDWEKKNYDYLESFYARISYDFNAEDIRKDRKSDLTSHPISFHISDTDVYKAIKKKEEESARKDFYYEHQRLLYLSREKNPSTNQMRGYAPSHLQNKWGFKEWDTTTDRINKEKDRPDTYRYYDKI